jgi:hypothetical protein
VSGKISHFGSLDLYDASAPVSEMPAGKRRSDCLFNGHDKNVIKRTFHLHLSQKFC